jgi:hypothetical protein
MGSGMSEHPFPSWGTYGTYGTAAAAAAAIGQAVA